MGHQRVSDKNVKPKGKRGKYINFCSWTLSTPTFSLFRKMYLCVTMQHQCSIPGALRSTKTPLIQPLSVESPKRVNFHFVALIWLLAARRSSSQSQVEEGGCRRKKDSCEDNYPSNDMCPNKLFIPAFTLSYSVLKVITLYCTLVLLLNKELIR